MVPASFGAKGFYRYDSLAEHMDKPLIHGGRDACVSCHQTVVETESKGKHASQSCEVCHAPLSTHVKDGQKIATMPSNATCQWCGICHSKLQARPASFPQIDIGEHLVKNGVIAAGEPIPEEACTTCHDAHNPME